ncbi:mechanosensitive ion channel protein [Xaviernesmea oryzae]|uniref:Mechanosensitive ion channel protein n=1 Tax=Xaviernesmea oryzae TaxID=464029 RepID=A0A1Q9B0K3_9HYPH|nr:mechanosensitive ion channel domain-containing protein [Xaviernesmea oryzae]OLP61518.1 mechanosensitive ion channel protein [Xaviernesmea oryzae]SEL66730.1 Small-conductance mechanosensitive channel [Xaviernesmea oryzae]
MISRFLLLISLLFAGLGTPWAQTATPSTTPPPAAASGQGAAGTSAPAQPPSTAPPQAGYAQAAASDDSTPSSQAGIALEAARRSLAKLTEQADRARDDDNRLAEVKASVDDVARQISDISGGLRPRLDQIKARLGELGDAPAAGSTEPAVVSDERKRLVAERNEINAVASAADDLSGRANQLSGQITETRRNLFSGTLLRYTEINLDVFTEGSSAIFGEAYAFYQNVSSWLIFVVSYKRVALLSAIVLSMISALVLLTLTRRLFSPLIGRGRREIEPSYITKLSIAFWSTMVPTVASLTFAASSYFFLQTFKVLRPDIAPVVANVLFGGAALVFLWMISHAVLAPGHGAFRLVRVSDRGANRLVTLIVIMAVVNLLDYLLGTISITLRSPIVLTVIKSFVASIIIGVILLWMAMIRPMLPPDAERHGATDVPGRPWPKPIRFLLIGAGAGLILCALGGYVGLARFIASQIVITGAILVTMYIGILTGKAIAKQDGLAKTVFGRYLQRRFKFEQVTLDQTGLAVGLSIYVLVFFIFIPLILLLWGFKIADLEAGLYQVLTNIQIGSISISLVGIFGGILLFVIGFLFTRWFQRWLDSSVLARSRVDLGVRNSVKTGVGYLGMGLAGLIGISAAGLNLSSLALVAGALSLGVGFGLQNIVSNFVSGLILLVERPFKVGDWVISGTTEGFVKRISVRATEIETFQRQTIMVPNSLFINASVGNWTHRNKLGRVDVPISVHGSNDPRHVIAVLREAVADVPNILRNPEPLIYFKDFSPDKLEFEVRVYLPDILNGLSVRTEVRIAALEAFRKDGVAIGGPAAPEVPVKISPDTARLLTALLEKGRGPHDEGDLDLSAARHAEDEPPTSRDGP